MNAHALDVLELSRALALVAERAVSALAADRIQNFQPTSDRAAIDHELARVSAARMLSTTDHPWSPDAAPDLVRPLERLSIQGAVVDRGRAAWRANAVRRQPANAGHTG